MTETLKWLLAGEPWVVYRTRLDLLGESEQSPAAREAYTALLSHPKITALLDDLADWPGDPLKSHKKAGHGLHKLVFLADLGLRRGEPAVDQVVEKVLANTSSEGPVQVLVNLPKRFGGSGEDEMSWMLCDAGSTLYALARMGWAEDPRVQRAGKYLASLVREENGWPCAATASLGAFRGPGKAIDPCPYANLLMIKALGCFGETYADPLEQGLTTLASLWEQRREVKPFLFAMGFGFEKLKAPFVWYDILHVLDVLSQFRAARRFGPVREMADIVAGKADEEGRFKPESIWMDWRGWDFGQKREPSRWLTFLVLRALGRFDGG